MTENRKSPPDTEAVRDGQAAPLPPGTAGTPLPEAPAPAPEVGGRGGAEPTRYGDWEINGRCVDF